MLQLCSRHWTMESLKKIPDLLLREFAARANEMERVPVIIEVPFQGIGQARGTQEFGSVERGNAETEKVMDLLEKNLKLLELPDPIVRLPAAEAFVANVTAAELTKLAQLDSVGMIRPNRTYRMPESSTRLTRSRRHPAI